MDSPWVSPARIAVCHLPFADTCHLPEFATCLEAICRGLPLTRTRLAGRSAGLALSFEAVQSASTALAVGAARAARKAKTAGGGNLIEIPFSRYPSNACSDHGPFQ